MKAIAVLFTAAILCCPLALQAQHPNMPTGRISAAEILDKYLTSTGGVEAHRKLTGLTAAGEFGFDLRHPMGDFSFYYKSPSAEMLHVQWISHGSVWVGHVDGDRVRKHSVEGIEMINGASLDIVEEDWVGLLDADFSARFSRIELIGLATVDKRIAYAVRFTPKTGDPQVRYYDAETFYLVRIDQVQRFKISKEAREVAYAVVSYFSEYRDVGGIKLPRQIAISRDIGNLLFQSSSMKLADSIPESVFSGVKEPK